MNINTGLDFYRTKDQQLASLLYATGQTLEATEWANGACYFVFSGQQECERQVSEYYKGNVEVNAKKLFDALQTIKGIIYSK